MPPKSKKQRIPKKGLKTKNKKKTKLPPDSASFEDDFVTDDEADPALRDIMNAIGTLSTRVAANEQRIATASTSVAEMLQPAAYLICHPTRHWGHPYRSPPPPEKDGLPEVKEAVCAWIADQLRGTPAPYLSTTDDESD